MSLNWVLKMVNFRLYLFYHNKNKFLKKDHSGCYVAEQTIGPQKQEDQLEGYCNSAPTSYVGLGQGHSNTGYQKWAFSGNISEIELTGLDDTWKCERLQNLAQITRRTELLFTNTRRCTFGKWKSRFNFRHVNFDLPSQTPQTNGEQMDGCVSLLLRSLKTQR